ncbi:MAG: HaeIII family restriction endonuclease [Mogibacterium sp.]|nr:HaeIII family restriction endonuclease [Mogibacterium sp.]
MINYLLVAATYKSFEEFFAEHDIPCELEKNEAYTQYKEVWQQTDRQGQDIALRQAKPAVERILSKELYVMEKSGDPIRIRFNGDKRNLDHDSFAELLIQRKDLDWAIGISVKKDAKVLTDMRVADRNMDMYLNHTDNVVNEIEDFGDRIFGVPCSNEYFDDVNKIMERIHAYDREQWVKLLLDDKFIYENVITPMLMAYARELPKLLESHPEAPMHFFDYFYGRYDYYYFNPIDELAVTRIGAVNPRGGLGRIPGTDNHFTNVVVKPSKLLDVRFATGKYGELSKDTIQLSFDGGWVMCFNIHVTNSEKHGRSFNLGVYMPVTPFGSYRDQVDWAPEA